jgi:hypothetical protein
MPRYQRQHGGQPGRASHGGRARQLHFRWALLTVPLAILILAWLGRQIQPATTWDRVLDAMDVRDGARCTQLTVLGVLICGVLLVLRILDRS